MQEHDPPKAPPVALPEMCNLCLYASERIVARWGKSSICEDCHDTLLNMSPRHRMEVILKWQEVGNQEWFAQSIDSLQKLINILSRVSFDDD